MSTEPKLSLSDRVAYHAVSCVGTPIYTVVVLPLIRLVRPARRLVNASRVLIVFFEFFGLLVPVSIVSCSAAEVLQHLAWPTPMSFGLFTCVLLVTAAALAKLMRLGTERYDSDGYLIAPFLMAVTVTFLMSWWDQFNPTANHPSHEPREPRTQLRYGQ